jgi:hypothetical protein
MKYIHSYRLREGNTLNDLELLTQILSVLKIKVSNKTSKIVLYVDTPTLEEYKKFGIEKLYDEVNTEVLDSFPAVEINMDEYWSSPKLWVMKHQEEPFCMLDVDLVLHNITDEVLERAKVSFLHTETPTHYAFPTTLNKPKAFKWTDWDVTSFVNSTPFNCAAISFTDMEFLKKYTDKYFRFVLNNPGGYVKELENFKSDFTHKFGAQITMEQWLLSSMIWQETHDEKGQILSGSWLPQSLTQAHMYPLNFKHQQHNIPGNVLMEEFNKQIFHLWGAKDFYDRAEKENEPELFKTWDDLKEGIISANNEFIQLHGKDEYYDILEKVVEYCREVPKDTN